MADSPAALPAVTATAGSDPLPEGDAQPAAVRDDRLDWHQIAQVVQRGCPVRLAIRIVG